MEVLRRIKNATIYILYPLTYILELQWKLYACFYKTLHLRLHSLLRAKNVGFIERNLSSTYFDNFTMKSYSYDLPFHKT